MSLKRIDRWRVLIVWGYPSSHSRQGCSASLRFVQFNNYNHFYILFRANLYYHSKCHFLNSSYYVLGLNCHRTLQNYIDSLTEWFVKITWHLSGAQTLINLYIWSFQEHSQKLTISLIVNRDSMLQREKRAWVEFWLNKTLKFQTQTIVVWLEIICFYWASWPAGSVVYTNGYKN